MRRRRIVEVALGLLAAPGLVLGQHGGFARAGSSAHFGGGVHSPSSSVRSRSFTPPSGSLFTNPAAHYPSLQSRQFGQWHSANSYHRYNDGRGGFGYRRRYPYVYAGYPWLTSFGYGLPLDYGFPYGDDQDDAVPPQAPPEQAEQPMIDYGPVPAGPEMAAYGPPPFRPVYPEQTAAAPVHAQPATTLIFKDGRPPVQVHNYALTGSTLYALDGESRQVIPLSLLNVPATVETNRASGVDFALPVSR